MFDCSMTTDCVLTSWPRFNFFCPRCIQILYKYFWTQFRKRSENVQKCPLKSKCLYSLLSRLYGNSQFGQRPARTASKLTFVMKTFLFPTILQELGSGWYNSQNKKKSQSQRSRKTHHACIPYSARSCTEPAASG